MFDGQGGEEDAGAVRFVFVRFVGIDVVEAFAEGESRGGEVVLLVEGFGGEGGDVVEGFGV